MLLRFVSMVVAVALVAGPSFADEGHAHKDKKDKHEKHEKHETHGDGTKEEHVEYSTLPQVVRTAFEKDFPGAKPVGAEKETYKDGTIHYEIEYTDANGVKHEVEYNADGEQLDEEKDGDEAKKDGHGHKHKKDAKKAESH